MKRTFLFILMSLLFLTIFPSVAHAHDVQPAYLEVTQTDATHLTVLWKIPARTAVARLEIQFPPDWKITAGPIAETTSTTLSTRWRIDCSTTPSNPSQNPLEGQHLAIINLDQVPAEVIVRILPLNAPPIVTRLNSANTAFDIHLTTSLWHLALTYTGLGIEHILMGVDHLLFVLGLMLIVTNRWKLLKTITAFTLAHSITLAIATFGYASAPLLPLNASIALSILFLGPEIVRRMRGQTSLTIRHLWIVAFAFGLLHGFGFASGLTSVGLSHSEIPPALLLFNVGVEIGQLFFVAIILGLEKSFRVLEIHWTDWARWIPAYTVGGLGAFWTIQRIAMLIGVIQ